MSCYVDDAIHPFGNMMMCHLWADSPLELFDMVDKIGVQRKWIQGHPTLSLPSARKASWIHFDIAKSKRALAIAEGAVECDKFAPLEHTALIYKDHHREEVREYGRKQMERVQLARARVMGIIPSGQVKQQKPDTAAWLLEYNR